MIIHMIVFGLLGIGLLFTLFRLIKGPFLPDRVVSLDTMNMIIVGVIGMLALFFENELFLDIAIVYAILSFFETVVFARYMEAKHHGHH